MIRMPYALITFCFLSTDALAQEIPPPGFEIVDITRDPDTKSKPGDLNNCGQAVYYKFLTQSGESGEIFLYDNGRITVHETA